MAVPEGEPNQAGWPQPWQGMLPPSQKRDGGAAGVQDSGNRGSPPSSATQTLYDMTEDLYPLWPSDFCMLNKHDNLFLTGA